MSQTKIRASTQILFDASTDLQPITVGDDYIPTIENYAIGVDASAGPILITLLTDINLGKAFYLKKLDPTENIVTIQPEAPDLIDDAISVNLSEQWSDCLVLHLSDGLWALVGGADEPAITPVDDRPTTMNEIIAAGVELGLWP